MNMKRSDRYLVSYLPSCSTTYRGSRWLAALCLTFSLLLLTSCQTQEAADMSAGKTQWRFALEEAKDSVQYAYAMHFKELIEQQTDGQVEVLIYTYGALGTSRETTEQLSMGVLEFAMSSPGSLGQYIPEIQVFLLHFLLPADDEQVAAVLQEPSLQSYIDELYEEKGLKLLSIFNEGEMVWTADRELRAPDDFSGVKFRTMTTPILLKSYGAYGASPTPMPYSEVYSGLQLNMIDGQVNPVFAIERQKFYEVCDWMVFPGHAHFVATAAANRSFFESLSPERKEIVTAAVQECDQFILKEQMKYQFERLAEILEATKTKKSDLSISGDLSKLRQYLGADKARELIDENSNLTVSNPLSKSERDVFRERSKQARQWFIDNAGERGAELLEQIIELSENHRDTVEPDAANSTGN